MYPAPDTQLAQALSTLAQRPDPTAWALVLDRTGPAMEVLARRLTGDGELARDAVQEALLQIRDSAGSFHAPAVGADRAARSWILRVTANTALALLRRQSRQQRREGIVSMEKTNQSQEVDSGLAAAELSDRMRSELAALPEPTRAAIVLRHCSGLPISDVATALGIPEGTAKIRVHRGLIVLRERLVRAGFTCSLLAVSGLLQQLPASEMPVSFTTTSAAHRLLTTTSGSSVAFIHQGFSMTTITSLATATAVLLIGGVSLLLSQDPPTPIPHLPITTEPVSAVPLGAIEIKPLPIKADPTALAKLENPLNNDEGPTWNDRLKFTDNRGFELNLWEFKNDLLTQPCSVPNGSTWKSTLDGLAKDIGHVWQMRRATVDFIPAAFAIKLNTLLSGKNAPSGTRTEVINWFSNHTGFTFKIHDSLGADDGKQYTWSAQTDTNETWLDGLALSMHATALLSFDGTVVFYKPPTVIPLDEDPEFIAKAPRLVYQAPPVARLEQEITLDFQDAEIAEVAKVLEKALHYPVDIDPVMLKKGAMPTVHLKVKDMKIRYVASWVAKLTGLEIKILPDRLRFNR